MLRVVLIVHDEPLILSLPSTILEDLGCQVLSADNGADALDQLVVDSRIGFLPTDIQMLGMSGYELAAEVRQRLPELPIVVMSGNTFGRPRLRGRSETFFTGSSWHGSWTLLGTKPATKLPQTVQIVGSGPDRRLRASQAARRRSPTTNQDGASREAL